MYYDEGSGGGGDDNTGGDDSSGERLWNRELGRWSRGWD